MTFSKSQLSSIYIYLILFVQLLFSCSNNNSTERKANISPAEEKYYDGIGVGPVTELTLESSIDEIMSTDGEKIFQSKCITCHTVTSDRRIGPGLLGITQRRRPEWIMNQILNPMEMTKKDSLSKELLSIYLSQMTNMELTINEARSVLEYFRDVDRK